MPSRPVAVVKGKSIYSDKQISSIVNTRITFSDGSWCDVATGEVVNRGQGYINIGTPSSSEEKTTTVGPKTYATRSLEIQGVMADVDIQPASDPHMTVTVEGSESGVENVEVQQQGDVLVIKGKDAGRDGIRGANVVITGGSGSISVGGGVVSVGGMRGGRIVSGQTTVVMSGGGDQSDVKVSVKVPTGTPVKVAGVQGNTVIGDTYGTLHASVLGGSDISAGHMRGAVLNVQGRGSITVASVNGNLNMNVQGSGDIRVRGGKVNMLTGNIMGSGDARFQGEAEDATLSVMGSGDIHVAHVKNRPVRNVMGHGDITVGNW